MDYSILRANLNKLIRKSSCYHYGQLPAEAQKSFEDLKKCPNIKVLPRSCKF